MSASLRRVLIAALIAGFLVMLAMAITVKEGEARVITRFGNPTRILTEPGLHWRLPPPIERSQSVDLRLRTTSSGLFNIQVADGSILEVEVFASWQVPQEDESVRTYIRAVGNNPLQAAQQLKTIMGSSMQMVSGQFALEDLLNADAEKLRLNEFENVLTQQVAEAVRTSYGIAVKDIGIERMAVPTALIDTTIMAMVKDREVLAEQRRGAGLEKAAAIIAQAEAEAATARSQAEVNAASLIAEAEAKAAALYQQAYQKNPELYAYLRSLESLRASLGDQSTLILRTDAAPLQLLTEPQTPATLLHPSALSLLGMGEESNDE